MTDKWHFSTKLNKLLPCEATTKACAYGAHFTTPEDAIPYITGLALQDKPEKEALTMENLEKIVRTVYIEATNNEEAKRIAEILKNTNDIFTTAVINNYYGLLNNMYVSDEDQTVILNDIKNYQIVEEVFLKALNERPHGYNGGAIATKMLKLGVISPNQRLFRYYKAYFSKEELLELAAKTPIGHSMLAHYAAEETHPLTYADKLKEEYEWIAEKDVMSIDGQETYELRGSVLSVLGCSPVASDREFALQKLIYDPESSHKFSNQTVFNNILLSPNATPVDKRLLLRRGAEYNLPVLSSVLGLQNKPVSKQGFTASEKYKGKVYLQAVDTTVYTHPLPEKEDYYYHKQSKAISKNAMVDANEPYYSLLKKQAKKDPIAAKRLKYASNYIQVMQKIDTIKEPVN